MGDQRRPGTDEDWLRSLMSAEGSSARKRRRAPSTSAGRTGPESGAPVAVAGLEHGACASQALLPQVSLAIAQAHGALAAVGPIVEHQHRIGSPHQRPPFSALPGPGFQAPQQLVMHGPWLLPQTVAAAEPVSTSAGQLAPFRSSIRSLQTAAMTVGPSSPRPQDQATSQRTASVGQGTASSSTAATPVASLPGSPHPPEPNQTPVASPLMPVAIAQPVHTMAMAPGAARPVPADRSQHGPEEPGLLPAASAAPAASSSRASSVSDAHARRKQPRPSALLTWPRCGRHRAQECGSSCVNPHRRLVHNEINRRRTTRINDLISARALPAAQSHLQRLTRTPLPFKQADSTSAFHRVAAAAAAISRP